MEKKNRWLSLVIYSYLDLGNRDLVIIRDGNKKVKIVNYIRWLSLVI